MSTNLSRDNIMNSEIPLFVFLNVASKKDVILPKPLDSSIKFENPLCKSSYESTLHISGGKRQRAASSRIRMILDFVFGGIRGQHEVMRI